MIQGSSKIEGYLPNNNRGAQEYRLTQETPVWCPCLDLEANQYNMSIIKNTDQIVKDSYSGLRLLVERGGRWWKLEIEYKVYKTSFNFYYN